MTCWEVLDVGGWWPLECLRVSSPAVAAAGLVSFVSALSWSKYLQSVMMVSQYLLTPGWLQVMRWKCYWTNSPLSIKRKGFEKLGLSVIISDKVKSHCIVSFRNSSVFKCWMKQWEPINLLTIEENWEVTLIWFLLMFRNRGGQLWAITPVFPSQPSHEKWVGCSPEIESSSRSWLICITVIFNTQQS